MFVRTLVLPLNLVANVAIYIYRGVYVHTISSIHLEDTIFLNKVKRL